MKLMKDIIPPDKQRFYKKEYLLRSCWAEKNRKRIFKELRSLGMPPYQAFQISIKRMYENE
tara:strand:- start:4389 stop:4571 length:183 start_codon:yes stop_codon:yes gene_type:complete